MRGADKEPMFRNSAALKYRITFTWFFCLMLFGCAGINKAAIKDSSDNLPAQNGIQDQAITADTRKKALFNLAVVPFAEKRGSLKSYGSVYSYLIPLVPYGTMRYERPDEARMFNTEDEFEFNMSENLLKVLFNFAKKRVSLFNSVIITPTPVDSKVDLILSGELYSTLYEGKTYSYGISFLGPALWCLGLPAGSSHKRLEIVLYLKKAATQELIWSYNINEENTVIQGLYHNWGKNVNSFSLLMRQGLKEAFKDMELKLKEIPLEKVNPAQDGFLPAQQQQQAEGVKSPNPDIPQKPGPAAETIKK